MPHFEDLVDECDSGGGEVAVDLAHVLVVLAAGRCKFSQFETNGLKGMYFQLSTS